MAQWPVQAWGNPYIHTYCLTTTTDTHTFMGLPTRSSRFVEILLYVTGVMAHLMYYKTEVLFVWPGAAHSQTEHNYSIPCNNRSVPNLVEIGRHLWEWRPKNLFVTYNRGRPGLWSIAVNEKTGLESGRSATDSVRRVETSAVRRQLLVFHRSFIDLAHRRRSGGISHSLIDDSTLDVT